MSETRIDKKILSIDGKDQEPEQRKEVGRVTPEERDEIRVLFERRNGLVELVKTLAMTPGIDFHNNPLYEKLTTDMGATATRFQEWWDRTGLKYGWEKRAGYQWEIDFESCVIYIRKQL